MSWFWLKQNWLSISFVYFISLIISSIISVISKTFYIQFVSLSPFSFFFPSSGGRVGVNREHLPLSLLPPCSKQWQ